jgi:hypothetical protein
VIVTTNLMPKSSKYIHELLKLHAWEVALESLRRRELVPLHVVEVLSMMVVRANGQQLRHVSFRLNTQKRLGDIEY